MQGGPQWTQVRARSEHVLVWLLIVTRTIALGQAVVLLALHWSTLTRPALAVLLMCLLTADNVVLFAVYLRRGRLHGSLLATLDAGLGIAGLVVSVIILRPTANPGTDEFLYPYTVASMCVAGMVYRKVAAPLIMATLAAAGFLATTFACFGPTSLAGLTANSSSYWAWALGSWFLATRFRRLSAELDQARRADIEREREVSTWRERAKLSRDLHDRILQTLEFVSRRGLISDARLRDHLAAEAVWLRDLVCGNLDRASLGLAEVLARVVAQQTDAGMRIELNTARLASDVLPREAVEALSGAVAELLTNVRKHSGTTRAILRAASYADQVTVTVLDHGCGFDPVEATTGLGLRESVHARIREIGGIAVIRSEQGMGTHAELSVPRRAVGQPHHEPSERAASS